MIIDPREKLRIERADRAESAGAWGVGIRLRPRSVDYRHVHIHLGPVVVVGGRGRVRRREQRQNAAGVGQRLLRGIGGGAELLLKRSLPGLGRGSGIEQQPAPKPIGVSVFFEIAAGGPHGGISVTIAAAGKA